MALIPKLQVQSASLFAVPWTVQFVPLIRYGHGKKGGEYDCSLVKRNAQITITSHALHVHKLLGI